MAQMVASNGTALRPRALPQVRNPGVLLIGASGLLTDIERQLSHKLTGRYSAAHHHPLP